ncbi:Carboxypeptidase M [Collichthys lucidus]|uniref:Carboxypeptidase M n=1 Tax=Collichthys lucidus TaxID=240159 RepID=A0A4U5VPI7_COLLU|nr:Carboxypeptidase M [Collichthys lucidus]
MNRRTDRQRTGCAAVMSSLLFLLLLLLFLVITSASTLEFRYHSNSEIKQYLVQINASNPDITHLHSIGRSVRGVSCCSVRKPKRAS